MYYFFLLHECSQDLPPCRTLSLPREMFERWPGPINFRIIVVQRQLPLGPEDSDVWMDIQRLTAFIRILLIQVILSSGRPLFPSAEALAGYEMYPQVLSRGIICQQKPAG